MHRRMIAISGVVALTLALVGSTFAMSVVRAQDATPVPGLHPLVGSWWMETDFGPNLVSFHDDETYFEVDIEGANGVGVWAATGAQTANMTSSYLEEDGTRLTVRAVFTVAADGQSFTAEYTLDFTFPDGSSSGEYGPGTATGTRLNVEPMGTPAGSIQDLFALFSEQPEGEVAADLEAYDIGWRTADQPGPSVTVTAAPGDTIEIANVGSAEHNFMAEALGIDVDLAPGEAVEVTIPAETAPGEYEFICNVPGHAAGGMVGTLIVG